jgi:predicted transcriptional regulator
MKTSYRNKIMIIGDVLRVAEESGNGINHTSLLRKTNLSHATLCKIIANLVSAGVISEQLARRQHSITIKGKDYLDRYRQFAGVSDAFGLQL